MYTPVPSSVVTKSPEITLKAFSAFMEVPKALIVRNECQLNSLHSAKKNLI
jgi:hypothetical protein